MPRLQIWNIQRRKFLVTCPVFFRLNAVNAAIFPVERGYRRYFSGLTPLTPLFSWLNAVNAAIFPVERR